MLHRLRQTGFFRNLQFARRNIRVLALWLLAAAALSSAFWMWAYSEIAREREAVVLDARQSASSQARAYADQLDRSLAQIDYIMLSMKHYWEETGGRIRLEKQLDAGLVSSNSDFVVTITDRAGKAVTSTRPFRKDFSGFASRAYFREHQNGTVRGLSISEPVIGLRSKRPQIILSRRLETASGAFDGVIAVSVEPGYLLAFSDPTTIHGGDFIEVRKMDGTFFAEKSLANAASGSTQYRSAPQFPNDAGIASAPGQHFMDARPRVVAWQKAKNYPVVSVVGVSVEDRLAKYREREHEMRFVALLVSAVLFLLGVGATVFSTWRGQKLRDAKEVTAAYRLATENAQDAFYMMRPIHDENEEIVDFAIEDCNEQGAINFGARKEKLLNTRMSSHMSATFRDQLLSIGRIAMAQGFHEEEAFMPAHGKRPAQWRKRRLLRSGRGLAVMVRDVTAEKAHAEKLHQLANSDALTSLPNRHWLTNYLLVAIEKARVTRKSLGVLFVDLDDFKNLNDTLGHAAGDELLKAAALRLKEVLRPQDSVARLGGDEFTMVLESIGSDRDIVTVAERIVDTLHEPFVVAGGHRHVVHASIGISVYPQDGEDSDTLLKNADIAMYAAKTSGKGNYRFFHENLSEQLVSKLTRQAQLKQALEQDELVVYYQPRVCGRTGELTSLEALARWRHPSCGVMQPDDFIPVAEETGLIIPLGEQVINKVCDQLVQWRAEGVPLVPVSVNVSARQINSGSVSAVIAAALERCGIAPDLIEVEITESATVGESVVASAELATLQTMGSRLYVDDFGTGYSSLSQLRRLDMHGIKVDRSFTAQLTDGPQDLALFRAIVSMAHAIDMQVVAEGVESAEQLALLQGLGCDEMQGYYISPPVPASDVLLMLQKRHLYPG